MKRIVISPAYNESQYMSLVSEAGERDFGQDTDRTWSTTPWVPLIPNP
jgi:hypothetical protein